MLAQADPTLGAEANPQTYALPASLATLSYLAAAAPPAASILYYDIEHWTSTPITEQLVPVASIATAAATAHSAGKSSGLASDGVFVGVDPGNCSYNIANGIVPSVDWSQIDYVNLQIQQLANDTKCGAGNTAQFVGFLNAAIPIITAGNPNIQISAQVSLRDESVAQIQAVINAVQSVPNLKAIYIAYPTNCTYCSPSNLATVLSSF